jgi:hypothetical protein
VLLFWHSDERSEQRTIAVELVKHNDRWLISSVARQ